MYYVRRWHAAHTGATGSRDCGKDGKHERTGDAGLSEH